MQKKNELSTSVREREKQRKEIFEEMLTNNYSE